MRRKRARPTAAARRARHGLAWALLCACQAASAPGPTPPREARPAGHLSTPPAGRPDEATPEERALLAARDRGDVAAMRAHGWALWAELQDRWPGFARSDAVLGQRDRIFRGLRPFRNGDAIEAETLPVMFTVAFDPSAAAHIQRYQLGARATLARLTEVPAFPRTAIALKLVWFAVHRDRPTPLPIWDDEPTLPDARGNPDRTWRRTIVVDPRPNASRDARPDKHDGAAVPLASFLHHALDDAEAAAARAVTHDATLAAGDDVILLGMHVTTKEIPDWVWATYWWHDQPDAGPFGAGRPAALTGAARHYRMDVAYSADAPRAPDGTPHACMNPWLEARFPGGLHSNCLTCHQRAAFGATDYLPVTRGALAPDDPYFAGKATTDFLWSLALEAR